MRQPYCGPAAVSAITGKSAECAAAWINWWRGVPYGRLVKASALSELEVAFGALGYGTVLSYVYDEDRPSFFRWMITERPTETFLILTTDHFIAVKGGKTVCSLHGEGVVTDLAKSPNKKKKVKKVCRVYEMPGACYHAIRTNRGDHFPEER